MTNQSLHRPEAATLGHLLAGISRLVGHRLRGKFSEIGLRHAQAMVLFHLWHDDGMAQNVLASRLHVSPPTATNTLQRMERDGWIERTRDPLDQRIVRVSLTAKAKALRADTGAAFHALDHELADILTDSEREVFLALLKKVHRQLCLKQKQNGPGPNETPDEKPDDQTDRTPDGREAR